MAAESSDPNNDSSSGVRVDDDDDTHLRRLLGPIGASSDAVYLLEKIAQAEERYSDVLRKHREERTRWRADKIQLDRLQFAIAKEKQNSLTVVSEQTAGNDTGENTHHEEEKEPEQEDEDDYFEILKFSQRREQVEQHADEIIGMREVLHALQTENRQMELQMKEMMGMWNSNHMLKESEKEMNKWKCLYYDSCALGARRIESLQGELDRLEGAKMVGDAAKIQSLEQQLTVFKAWKKQKEKEFEQEKSKTDDRISDLQLRLLLAEKENEEHLELKRVSMKPRDWPTEELKSIAKPKDDEKTKDSLDFLQATLAIESQKNKMLQRELDELKETINLSTEATAERELSSIGTADLEKKLKEARDELMAAKTKTREISDSCRSLQATVDEKSEQMLSAQQKLEAAEEKEKEMTVLCTSLEETVRETSALAAKIQNELDDVRVAESRIASEIEREAILGEKMKLEVELREARDEARALQTMVVENRQVTAELEEELGRTKEESTKTALLKETLLQQVLDLESQLERLQEEKDAQERRSEELAATCDTLQKTLEEKSTLVARLQKDLAESENRGAMSIEVEADNDASQIGETVALRQDLLTTKNELQTVEGRAKELAVSCKTLQEMVDQKSTLADRLHKELEMSKASEETLVHEKMELQKELESTREDLKQTVDRFELEAKKLQEEREFLQKEVEALKTSIEQDSIRVEKELRDLQDTISSLESEKSAFENRANEMTETCKSLEAALEEKTQVIAKLLHEMEKTTNSENTALVSDKAELEVTLNAAQEELRGVRQARDQMEAENEKTRKDFTTQIEEEKAKAAALELALEEVEGQHKEEVALLSQKLLDEKEKTASVVEEAEQLRGQVSSLERQLEDAQTALKEMETKNTTIKKLEGIIEASKAELARTIEAHGKELSEQRKITKTACDEMEHVYLLGEQVENAMYAHKLVKEKTIALEALEDELEIVKADMKTKTKKLQRELANQTEKTRVAMEEAASSQKELKQTKQALEESLSAMEKVTNTSSETIQALREAARLSNEELMNLHGLLTEKGLTIEKIESELEELRRDREISIGLMEQELEELSKERDQLHQMQITDAETTLLDSVLEQLEGYDWEDDLAFEQRKNTEEDGKIDFLLSALENSQDEIVALRREIERNSIAEGGVEAKVVKQ